MELLQVWGQAVVQAPHLLTGAPPTLPLLPSQPCQPVTMTGLHVSPEPLLALAHSGDTSTKGH